MQFLFHIDFLSSLVHLKQLNLNFCYHLEDITGLEHLVHLESLHLKECSYLKEAIPSLAEKGYKELTLP